MSAMPTVMIAANTTNDCQVSGKDCDGRDALRDKLSSLRPPTGLADGFGREETPYRDDHGFTPETWVPGSLCSDSAVSKSPARRRRTTFDNYGW
jgi:hypothetical protein